MTEEGQSMKIETTRLAILSDSRFRRAPSQTGQATFIASGFPPRLSLPTLSVCTDWFAGVLRVIPPVNHIRAAPWTAALRLVRGLPARRLLQRLCHQQRSSLPLRVSLAASFVGFPGSVITLYPTALGFFPQLVGGRVPVLVTVTNSI